MVTLIVSTIVAILVVTSILVPVVNDPSVKTKEVHTDNTGVEYYEPATSVTMTGNGGASGHTEDFALSINGTSVDPAAYTIILASSTLNVVLGGDKEYFAMDVVNNGFAVAGYEDAVSITVASGEYTATLGGKTLTGTISDMLIWSGTEGSYTLTNAATVNTDSSGMAYVGGILWGNPQGIAKISDLTTGTQTYTTYAITDFVVTGSSTATLNWTVDDNGNGSYDISAFTDSDNNTPINLFVPVEYYTLESNNTSSLLGIVPILVLVGILVGVIAAVFPRTKNGA